MLLFLLFPIYFNAASMNELVKMYQFMFKTIHWLIISPRVKSKVLNILPKGLSDMASAFSFTPSSTPCLLFIPLYNSSIAGP